MRLAANGESWCWMFSACHVVRAASRDAWGTCLSLQPARSHRRTADIDWATTLQRFVSAERRAAPPCSRHAEPAASVTHNGRRERLHDYNTPRKPLTARRVETRSRCSFSGSQALPTSAPVSRDLMRWHQCPAGLRNCPNLSLRSTSVVPVQCTTSPAMRFAGTHLPIQAPISRHYPYVAPGNASVEKDGRAVISWSLMAAKCQSQTWFIKRLRFRNGKY